MNPLQHILHNKKNDLLNIYFTAGYPKLEDTAEIILSLQDAGVSIIEIGFPYSDPIADGPVIQKSSMQALENGINVQKIFNQIAAIKDQITVPLIAMGYYNQFLQYGEEKFLAQCAEVGISACIFPDLPLDYYEKHYAQLFKKYGISNIFLVSPQTSDERIHLLSEASDSFLYLVSSAATTGNTKSIDKAQEEYFTRIQQLELTTPCLIGFGIHNKESYQTACKYASGAIIGSAFIKALDENNLQSSIHQFIQTIK